MRSLRISNIFWTFEAIERQVQVPIARTCSLFESCQKQNQPDATLSLLIRQLLLPDHQQRPQRHLGNWATATATVAEFVFQNYLGVLPASNAYSPDFGMQLPTIQIQIQMLLKCTLFVGVKFQSNPNLINSSLVIFSKQYLRSFLLKNVISRAWDEGSSS